MTCKVESNPPATFKWLRGMRAVLEGGRFKYLTQADQSTITLIMQKLKSQDDGIYTLTVENEHGSDSVNIKVFVTDPAGMDFRAMLKHK